MNIGTALTGAQLYKFASRMITNGQSDTSVDKFTFYSTLNTIKQQIEAEREWVILRAQDKSQQALPSDNSSSLTSKPLPADFMQFQSEKQLAISLLGATPSQANYLYYDQIPMGDVLIYQIQSYKFMVDYANNVFYLMGNVNQPYTINLFYLKSTPDFNINDPNFPQLADAQTWAFPGFAHPVLAYYFAAMYKNGIDYDAVNARQAGDNYNTVKLIRTGLRTWDSKLQMIAQKGVDRAYEKNRPWISGTVNINGG